VHTLCRIGVVILSLCSSGEICQYLIKSIEVWSESFELEDQTCDDVVFPALAHLDLNFSDWDLKADIGRKLRVGKHPIFPIQRCAFCCGLHDLHDFGMEISVSDTVAGFIDTC